MSAGLPELQRAVLAALEAYANPQGAEGSRTYHKYEGFVSLGLDTPTLRRVLRALRPTFRQLPAADRLALAESLLAVGVEEPAHAGVYVLALSLDALLAGGLDTLDRCLDHVRSWSVTDDFCLAVLQPLLWRDRHAVVPLLEQWARSGNRWKRRASAVAFVRKVGASGQFTDDALRLCGALIWDRDDLVQKAVGWALKDTIRGDRDRVIAYVRELRRQGAPATITLYAIRDLKGEERQAILSISRSGPGA